jgi:hypothetical protein
MIEVTHATAKAPEPEESGPGEVFALQSAYAPMRPLHAPIGACADRRAGLPGRAAGEAARAYCLASSLSLLMSRFHSA